MTRSCCLLLSIIPDDVASIKLLVGGAGSRVVFFEDGFESGNTHSWSTGANNKGEWAGYLPQGIGAGGWPGGSPYPDPSSAFEGDYVRGNDVRGSSFGNPHRGSYENSIRDFLFPQDTADACAKL